MSKEPFIIGFTGHRPNKLNNDYDLVTPLTNIYLKGLFNHIINLHHPTAIISGMALGIDILAAETALENNIQLWAAIPCRQQCKMWPRKSIDRYFKILDNQLTITRLVCDVYYNNTCMQIRNEWIVDNSHLLIAVHDGSPGGTYNCIKYARSVNKNIITINPNNAEAEYNAI